MYEAVQSSSQGIAVFQAPVVRLHSGAQRTSRKCPPMKTRACTPSHAHTHMHLPAARSWSRLR